jgi:CheY-like chemotaxis protein
MFARALILHAGPGRRRSRLRPGQATHRRRETKPSAQPSPARRPLKALTLLVVEDNADSRELLRRMLTSLGARVLLAEHGRQALDVLEQTRPHAILLDLMMPVMDGFTFVQRMRLNPSWAHIPVIALTALSADRDYARTWTEGFAGHLAKPIAEADLVAALQRILHGHRRPPSPPPEGPRPPRPGLGS